MRYSPHNIILLAILIVAGVSCENTKEEPLNPLFGTWVFYSYTYTDCDDQRPDMISDYTCDESSCLQVTFADTKYYVMDVKYDVYHQKKLSKIIVNKDEGTFMSHDDYGGYLGVCSGGGIPTTYTVNGDTLTLMYPVEFENCTRVTTLTKKY